MGPELLQPTSWKLSAWRVVRILRASEARSAKAELK